MSLTPGTSQHNAADPTLPHINSGPVKNAIKTKVFLDQCALIATGNNFTYKTLANILFNTAHEGKIPNLTTSIIKAVGFLIMNKTSSQISDELSNTLINKSLTASQPLINDLECEHNFIKSIMAEQSKNMINLTNTDEPPHQILSYTLLFSLFLHFLYIVDPPLRTSAPTRPHAIALTPSDQSRLFDGHMTYNSHVFISILSVSNVPPPAV